MSKKKKETKKVKKTKNKKSVLKVLPNTELGASRLKAGGA